MTSQIWSRIEYLTPANIRPNFLVLILHWDDIKTFNSTDGLIFIRFDTCSSVVANFWTTVYRLGIEAQVGDNRWRKPADYSSVNRYNLRTAAKYRQQSWSLAGWITQLNVFTWLIERISLYHHRADLRQNVSKSGTAQNRGRYKIGREYPLQQNGWD